MKKYTDLLNGMSPSQLERFAGYLASLPTKHQTIVSGVLTGKKQKELAELTGIGQSAVSQLLKRTLAAITEMEVRRGPPAKHDDRRRT